MSAILCNDATASTQTQQGSLGEPELAYKSWNAGLEKPPAILDADDETTDIGHTSGSDTESSSGTSSGERRCRLSQRCRFEKTSFGTVPSTPCAGATMSLASPPGLSRAALRHARDSCKTQGSGAPDAERSTDRSSHDDVVHTSQAAGSSSSSTRTCRFSKTMLGTVPKTPVNVAKWKALANVFGSPPGLSHTEKRRARDACKAPISEEARRGSGQDAKIDSGDDSLVLQVSDRKQTARERLGRLKQEAASLRDLAQKAHNPQDLSNSSSESEDDIAAVERRRRGSRCEDTASKAETCCLSSTSFGTVPSAPTNTASAFSSPPGLSRKAMREARDAFKAPVQAAPTWGTHAAKQVMAVNPPAKPSVSSAESTPSQAPR